MLQVKPTDRLSFDLEMLQIDYNEQKVRGLRKEIADKYGVPFKNVEINFCPIVMDKDGNRISLTENLIKSIQDPNFQKGLFEEYIRNKKELQNVDLEAINVIDNSVNAFIDFDSYRKYKTYQFKYIRWKNFLSYGTENYVDFTALKGLVLLNGDPENQSGKTTFAKNLLRFALFGKVNKTSKLEDVFNRFLPEETEVMVEVGLVIDDTDYVIRRRVTRPTTKKRTKKSQPHQKVEYFKRLGDDLQLIENCEDDSSTQTNNVIREAVGNVDDFDLIIAATEYNLREILEKGETERGKLFSRWLGLVTIEDKEKKTKELYKETILPTLQSQKYNKDEVQETIKRDEKTIKDDKKEIRDLEDKKNKSQKTLDQYEKDKTDLLSRKKEIKSDITGESVESLDNKIKQKREDFIRERDNYKAQQTIVETNKDATYDDELYKSKEKQKKEWEAEYNDINAQIRVLKEGTIKSVDDDTKRIKALIEQGVCPTCGQKIDVAVQQDFIDKNNKKRESLIEKGIELKGKQDKIKTDIDDIEKEMTEMKRQEKNITARNLASTKMSAHKAQMDKLSADGKLLVKQKQDLEDNKDNIKINSDIDEKVNVVNANIKTERDVKEGYITEIQKYRSEIETLEKSLSDNRKILETIEEEEKIIRNWNIYQELVGKNGIVKIALRMALPIINNEISRMLGDLCDFEVCISVSDENKVRLDFVREGEVFDLGSASSGFEGTMASLAIRTALATLGNMPKPNLLILDEVIGAVGQTNFDNLRKLYERILDKYDFILHICHESMAEDWHERVVTAVKENNISRITVD